MYTVGLSGLLDSLLKLTRSGGHNKSDDRQLMEGGVASWLAATVGPISDGWQWGRPLVGAWQRGRRGFDRGRIKLRCTDGEQSVKRQLPSCQHLSLCQLAPPPSSPPFSDQCSLAHTLPVVISQSHWSSCSHFSDRWKDTTRRTIISPPVSITTMKWRRRQRRRPLLRAWTRRPSATRTNSTWTIPCPCPATPTDRALHRDSPQPISWPITAIRSMVISKHFQTRFVDFNIGWRLIRFMDSFVNFTCFVFRRSFGIVEFSIAVRWIGRISWIGRHRSSAGETLPHRFHPRTAGSSRERILAGELRVQA